jgi:2-keto-4-pentenoate hydratase/2-oxohepta-3-ene-1,7-dioic acid hydratase in catechol pathway
MRIVRYQGEYQDLAGLVDGASVQSCGSWASFIADGWKPAGLHPVGEPLELSAIKLLAPIAPSTKGIGIGFNYKAHREETGRSEVKGATPLLFAIMPNALTGPGDAIPKPEVVENLDYEAELVAVVGRTAKDVPEQQAWQYILGYTCGNDVSAREWQRQPADTMNWVFGKSSDGSCPIGPWIVTREEIPDVSIMSMRCYVNGDRRQEASIADMIWSIPEQLAFITKAVTLFPGDVIFTGTCGGVGSRLNPPQWLELGDSVRIEIDPIGAIENVVARR